MAEALLQLGSASIIELRGHLATRCVETPLTGSVGNMPRVRVQITWMLVAMQLYWYSAGIRWAACVCRRHVGERESESQLPLVVIQLFSMSLCDVPLTGVCCV